MDVLDALCPITSEFHHALARASKRAKRRALETQRTDNHRVTHCTKCDNTGMVCSACGHATRACDCPTPIPSVCPICEAA